MSWALISDSTCDIRSMENLAPDTFFATVPLKIRVGDREYVDNAALDVLSMVQAVSNYNGTTSSACPAPEEWVEKFLQADCVIVNTITSGLSGSYNSAMVARDMVLESHPEKKIHVVDNRATGGKGALILWRANELIAEGWSFEAIVEELEALNKRIHCLFALSCFDNLVKNGRMSKLVGFAAGMLNMRGVGCATPEGTIHVMHKTRGDTRMLAYLLEEIDRRGYTGESLMTISHCDKEEASLLLKNAVQKKWPGSKVILLPCCGLNSYYAERKGLILCF